MKQRLGIAQAMLNDPRLGRDTIVLMSTHIVSDVEKIADHMLMMSNGKIILNEPWDKGRTDLEQLYMGEFGGDGE